ncbi:MAG: hypothetical protein IKY19_07265 [Bacteroidaceae bacterium]|nr:hypothetical protein [Bacteroidaceae bacterium]
MEENKINVEVKSGIKAVGKFINKVNPNTDYQAKLKNDIKYINRELESEDIEVLINCNKNISAQYGYLLVKKGFIPMLECDIRERGYDWNLENLKQIRNSLETELLVGAASSSIGEAGFEYLAEKLFGMR